MGQDRLGLKCINSSTPLSWCGAKVMPHPHLPPLRGGENPLEAKRGEAGQM